MSRDTGERERGRMMRTACPYCGYATMDEEASFCSRCGKPLHTAAILVRRRERVEWLDKIKDAGSITGSQPLQDSEAQEIWNRMASETQPAVQIHAEPDKGSASGSSRFRRFFRPRLWMLPAAALLASCLLLLGIGLHDAKVNNKVKAWHLQAEREALAGQYANAEQLLRLAASSRPGHAGILKDLDIVHQAAKLDADIKSAAAQLDLGSLEQAESGLRQTQAALGSRHEELFNPLRDKLAGEAARLTVKQISSELDGLGTIKELAERLQRLRGLQAPGVPELRQRITESLIQLGIGQAEKLLKKKDFSAARAAIDETVEHVGNAQSLQNMTVRIEREKEEYEEQEQKRLNAAMQMANLEQRQNRTDAFDILELSTSLNEKGETVISGKVKSKATRGIRSIRLFYVLKDAEGTELGTGIISIAAGNAVEPGGTAQFQQSNSSVHAEAVVTITNATWYID